MGFHVRPPKKEDVPFVLNSWMKSWRKSKFSGVISNNEYFTVTRNNIEHLVARGAVFRVACLDSDEDAILGWICYEKLKTGEDCVHYIYIKDPYLKMGVSDALVKEVGESGFYTYKFSQVVEFLPKYRWVPEIARRKD